MGGAAASRQTHNRTGDHDIMPGITSRNDSTQRQPQTGVLPKPTNATRRYDSAARLGGYLSVGLGAGILGTSQAEAAIISIDIGATGFNIGGVNAGLSEGVNTSRTDFPNTGAGTLWLYNKDVYVGEDYTFTVTGLSGYDSGLIFAGMLANPVNFAFGSAIDGTTRFNSYATLFYRKVDDNSPTIVPDFNPGSYVGFKTAQGNYGWLEVTWSGSLGQFQIFSGAYESVVGVSIAAGDTGPAAVPEIDPASFGSALSLVMGSLAMLEHRRRKREESVAAATVA
jgi:hypothetical protein